MRVLKIIGKIVGVLLGLIIVAFLVIQFNGKRKRNNFLKALGDEAPTLTINGNTFRDLNKNGVLDVYEDVTAAIEDRVDDLVSQMTIEEKAGSMFITMIGFRGNGEPIDEIFIPGNMFDIMGMMMLPPVIVSLPFKLIFFVLIDGWYMVVGSLVKSFSG